MDEIGDLVVALIGTPARVVVAIGLLSLLVINLIWLANSRRSGLNLTQHLTSVGIAALGGLVLLVGAAKAGGDDEVCCDVGGGEMKMVSSATCPAPVDKARCEEPDALKAISIEATLARPSAPKEKIPDKVTKAPDEKIEKPQGVAKNDKEDPKVCCDLGGENYKMQLLSTCRVKVDAKKCEKKRPITKPEEDKLKPIPHRPDPDENPNAQTGPVHTPTSSGPPNNNKRGFADVDSGHPYWRDLAADIHENFKFPAISEAQQIAQGCFYFRPDGTIAGWRLIPPSGIPELDLAVEIALQAVEKKRNANPKALPNELVEAATTQWICFPLGKLKREN